MPNRYREVTVFFFIAVCCFFVPDSPVAGVRIEQAFPNLTFSRPVDLQHSPDGSGRLFVVEQSGRIYVFENMSTVSAALLFLNITDRVNSSGNEEGLLGLAFHPQFSENGYFYVNYTASSPRRTVISRFSVNRDNINAADRDSERVLIEVDQPYSNHNGGQIAFGPDGMFYAAFGDGGSARDPLGNGQDRQTLLGSIIRIDVDLPGSDRMYDIPSDNPFYANSSGYREEIYAYGLRNPWRFSFDSETGKMWAGDVGQNRLEEIDIIDKGNNYGWKIMEGSECHDPITGCDRSGLTLPVWEYGRSQGGSVTGGFVYRGEDQPYLFGKYIYADFISGKIWALEYDGINPPVNEELLDTDLFISSFGIDENNELNICSFDGKIYRFKPEVTGVKDENGVPDEFGLSQNYPNPFNTGTRINYRITKASRIEISIYAINGSFVRNLVDSMHEPGVYACEWDGMNKNGVLAASGIYLYRLRAETGISLTRKMVMIK